MTNKKLLLIGGGGHCKSVLDSLLQKNEYTEIGVIDTKENLGKKIINISICGCDEDLIDLYKRDYNYAFITVGSIGDPSLRIKLFKRLEEIGFVIPIIIDSSATISNFVNLEAGIYIGKKVVVNAGTSIGKGAIINTSSIIEHDCTIGNFSHISPGSVLCGGVKIGENSHIGANTVIRQDVKIGVNTIIGLGSVVLHTIGNNLIAYGNPCKEVKKNECVDYCRSWS